MLGKGRRDMNAEFPYGVFLSHCSKDKAVVRPLAERFGADGLKVWPVPPKRACVGGFDEWVLKPGVPLAHWMGEGSGVRTAKVDPPSGRSNGGTRERLESSRALVCPSEARARGRMLCMSANRTRSNPAVVGLEAGTCGRGNLSFRDSLNQGRCFLPLGLDDADLGLLKFLEVGDLGVRRTKFLPPSKGKTPRLAFEC
jgi:hypothetical protein